MRFQKMSGILALAVFLVTAIFAQAALASSYPAETPYRSMLRMACHILRAGGMNVFIMPDLTGKTEPVADSVLYLFNGPTEAIRAASREVYVNDSKILYEALEKHLPRDFRQAWDRGVATIRSVIANELNLSALAQGTGADIAELEGQMFWAAIQLDEEEDLKVGEAYASEIFPFWYSEWIDTAIDLMDSEQSQGAVFNYFGVSSKSELTADALAGLVFLAQQEELVSGGGSKYLLGHLSIRGHTALGERFWTFWQTECPEKDQQSAARDFTFAFMKAVTEISPACPHYSTLTASGAGVLAQRGWRVFDIMVERNFDPETKQVTRNIKFNDALSEAKADLGIASLENKYPVHPVYYGFEGGFNGLM